MLIDRGKTKKINTALKLTVNKSIPLTKINKTLETYCIIIMYKQQQSLPPECSVWSFCQKSRYHSETQSCPAITTAERVISKHTTHNRKKERTQYYSYCRYTKRKWKCLRNTIWTSPQSEPWNPCAYWRRLPISGPPLERECQLWENITTNIYVNKRTKL